MAKNGKLVSPMTSCSINSVAAVRHTGSQVQAVTHTAVAGHRHHECPAGGPVGEAAVGIDHPAVGSPTGNRTKPVGHQGADHMKAELGPGVAGVDRMVRLRTGLSMQVEVHRDVRCLVHPWCRRRNQ